MTMSMETFKVSNNVGVTFVSDDNDVDAKVVLESDEDFILGRTWSQ